ncbi:MAG: WG repeat-containing protein [Firmicutes bacterium]|nr:WG repeat-containing protein [Bacillota bacterium]
MHNQQLLLAPVCKDEKWGYINQKGEMVIDCQFYEAEAFENGLARVKCEKDGHWQSIDGYGHFVEMPPMNIPCPEGKILGEFRQGIAKVGYYKHEEYSSSETVYDNAFDDVGHEEWSSSSADWFIHGYMDENGKMLTGYDYVSMGPQWDRDEISEGIVRITDAKSHKVGYMDKTGRLLVKCEWDAMFNNFHDGLAQVWKMILMFPKEGFINTKGEMVIKKRWERAGDFHEGLAWIRAKGKYDVYNYINKNGTTVIGPRFWERCGDFHEGLAWIQREELCGFIDKTGKNVIPCQWGWCKDFHEGLAAVRKEGCWDWGWIDKNGNVVIDCEWEGAGDFARV